MNDRQKLPRKVAGELRKRQIPQEEIIYWTHCDENESFQFTEGYLVLTREQLLLLIYPPIPKRSYHFGGYSREVSLPGEDAEVVTYDLKDCTGLQVQHEIGRITLVVKKKDGDVRAAYSSKSLLSHWMTLRKICDKLIKQEEITEEDYRTEKKEACCPKCGTMYPDQERKICPKCMDRKSVFLRILQMFLRYKGSLIVMMICYLATAMLNLVWPYLSGTVLYDRILSKDEEFLALMGTPGGGFLVILGWLAVTMILARVLIQAIGILQMYLTARIVPEVVGKLREQVFQAMGKLSVSFYNKRQTGSLMTRVLSDTDEVTSFFIDGVPFFLINLLTIVMTVTVMFSINVPMAIVSLIMLPIMGFLSYRMMPRLWSYFGKRHRAKRSMNAQINDNITGARVVKAFGQEHREMDRFAKNNKRMRDAELNVTFFNVRYDVVYMVGENLASILVWSLGAALILHGSNLAVGVLLTFTGYVGQLNGPLDFFSFCFRWWSQSLNSAQRVFEIIDTVPEIQESEHPLSPDRIQGKVEFRDVSFAYETGKPVLKNISFTVEPGQMLGIVGRSGAGKTTLVNLMSRLYDPTEGSVWIDDINVKDMAFEKLYGSIAMVSQETYVFMGTVAENIAYARPNATRQEIIAAAIRASAHDFICKMPDGYDTVIGSSGRSLSGGERQRLSIARAILANPRILILDEATAAVDTETESAIQASLEQLIQGRTTISIAHRLSTLKNADRLIVMDNGKLTEEGTHQELVELQGTYYKLMQLQTKALAMRGIE